MQDASVWMALSDPTRRRILDLLRAEPLTTGHITAQFPQTRFAVMKHLSVLVRSGLVTVRREGRTRWNYLNPVPIRVVCKRWVKPFEAKRADALLDLKERIEGESRMQVGIHQVAFDVQILAGRERVWKALTTEMDKWWRRDFLVNPDAKQFYMEPQVGGRVFEDWGNGAGVLWFTVMAIDPGKSVDLVGHLTPAFGGPATSMVRFAIDEAPEGVLVRVSDSTMGKESPGCEASKQDGWFQLIGKGLKSYVEKPTVTKSASGSRRPR